MLTHTFGNDSHYQWKILHPTGVYCSEDKSLVIFDCLDGTYYSLENRATVIWKLLELGLSMHQLMTYFDMSQHKEIYHLVKSLEGKGLIAPNPNANELSLAAVNERVTSIIEAHAKGSFDHKEHTSTTVQTLIEERGVEEEFTEIPIPEL